jgi:hypothetical protein
MMPELFQRQAKVARDLRNILADKEQAKQQIMWKEQKIKRDALDAEKDRLKKERADRELPRKDADQKVDDIMAGVLAAALKTKGRTYEKKLKALLDMHFFTIETPLVASPGLPEGDRKVDVNEENPWEPHWHDGRPSSFFEISAWHVARGPTERQRKEP